MLVAGQAAAAPFGLIAFARIEDPAERVWLAFKLFDSEDVTMVNCPATAAAR
jgi:hypothetical protein